jgi:hypothetical protein
MKMEKFNDLNVPILVPFQIEPYYNQSICCSLTDDCSTFNCVSCIYFGDNRNQFNIWFKSKIRKNKLKRIIYGNR